MHVVHLASEVAPYAKTGGLGDVLGALPAALVRAGVRATVCLPGYRRVLEGWPTTSLGHVDVPVSGRVQAVELRAIVGAAVPTVLAVAPALYDRDGLYGPDGDAYPDNAERFVVFCRAALAWLARWPHPPSLLHVHDWQTALAPAFLRADARRYPGLATVPTITTIHNLAYQGRFWEADWHLLDLDRRFFAPDALEFWGQLNFLKAGLVFADAVTTVSPHYAAEIQTPAFGEGLDGVLRARTGRVHGILNGIDPAVWDPATDPHLRARYDATRRRGKRRCKAALQQELGLALAADAPLAVVITRLAAQKGVDVLLEAAPALLRDTGLQLAILGNGDAPLEAGLQRLAATWPGRVAARIAFDEALAHRFQAGGDLLLMPSRYEPCGLAQLYALRYGTVPVVHATGGLVDTVVDADAAREGTGFAFAPLTATQLRDAVSRALRARADARRWSRIVRTAMAQDFSWNRSASRYRALYETVSNTAASRASHGEG